MISQLKGLLIYRSLPVIVLDVHGVGYEIEATAQTFAALPDLNQEATVYTHFAVREDAQLLYGFASLEEREVFRTLIKISGVGGKMAIAILSSLPVHELAAVIENDDVSGLQRIPGVGKKTAQRLIVELKGKFTNLPGYATSSFAGAIVPDQASGDMSGQKQAVRDAIHGLVALGYKESEADKMLAKILKNTDTNSHDSETLIRAALKQHVR